MQSVPDLGLPRDDATMKLAHPQRCATCLSLSDIDAWKTFMGPTSWAALESKFREQGGLTADVLANLCEMPEHASLRSLTELLAESESSTEMGGAFAVMLYARNLVSPQPHFLIDDALVEMLEHTDISDDVPVSTLTLPFPRCYIELGRRRECSLVVPNPATGLHILEGAYFESGTSASRGPGVFVMLTGSPLERRDAMDDATNSLFIPMVDPDQPLREALLGARMASIAMAQSLGLRPEPLEHLQPEFEALRLLAKVLLYLNLPEARRTLVKEKSKAMADARAKKNPSKRAKAEKALARLTDYILISPPQGATPLGGTAHGRGVKGHWRRGHYRMQRHGPALSLQKLIFLQPVLVGGLESPAGAQYRVT